MGFNIDEVVSKIQELDIDYIKRDIGNDPALLPHHVAEYNGYATLMYDHFASVLRRYRIRAAEIEQEEAAKRAEYNKDKKRGETLTIAEMQQRVDIRISGIKAQRDSLEMTVRGVTLHLNVCQSLMKNWGDEAKGVR